MEQLRSIYHKEVPRPFIEGTLRTLVQAWADGAREAQTRFNAPEAHDLRGHLRRAHLEQRWRELANSTPGVRVSVVRNRAGSAFHTRVQIGRIIMTESAVEHETDVPRYAHFRQTLAQHAQLGLFDPAPVAIPRDGLLYAVLYHGPSASPESMPSFVGVGFPDKECSRYVTAISLTQMMRDLVERPAAVERAETEHVSEPQPLGLKNRRARDEAGGA